MDVRVPELLGHRGLVTCLRTLVYEQGGGIECLAMGVPHRGYHYYLVLGCHLSNPTGLSEIRTIGKMAHARGAGISRS